MNWNEKADEGAIEYYSDWCPPGTLETHRRGAKWQRDQLRTDEALEPWARAIYTEANTKDPWAPKWESADEYARGAAYSRARGMINMLLGSN